MSGRDPGSYAYIKTLLYLGDTVVTVIALLLFQHFVSVRLSGVFLSFANNFYGGCFFYLTTFYAFLYIIGFPLHFIGTFTIEHKFGLSCQKLSAWYIDEVKSILLGIVLSMAGGFVFFFIFRAGGQSWWMILAGIWILFSLIIARVVPVLIIPIFFKYTSIDNEEITRRIFDLGKRTKINITNISKIDFSKKTKKANAALAGLGKTRKVILADTLIDEFTPEEVEMVVAHEFGHHKYFHIWQLLFFSGICTVSGFWILSGLISAFYGLHGGDAGVLAVFPVLIIFMIVYNLCLKPAYNYFSRILEKQSDRFALEVTNSPDTFISVMKKLARMNLSEIDPPFLKKIFFYDHPPIVERIKMGEEWVEPKGISK
jgi:Zn-dependent protease with chaperone function